VNTVPGLVLVHIRPERYVGDKQPSLFALGFSVEEKKFYNIFFDVTEAPNK
jgi:hypothetical protein